MKFKKLVKNLGILLDADAQEQRRHRDELKKLLKKLKEKAKSLEKKAKTEGDPANRKEYEDKLKILNAQRKKGVALLRQSRRDGG